MICGSIGQHHGDPSNFRRCGASELRIDLVSDPNRLALGAFKAGEGYCGVVGQYTSGRDRLARAPKSLMM